MRVKYVRVSTKEQNSERQSNYEGSVFLDKCSGSIAFKKRPEAKKILKNKEITEVVVHSIDRLGRDVIDILQTIKDFTNKGINVISEKEGLQTIINGKENPIAKMIIGVLGTLAEFELSRIKERQSEGIAAAKLKGIYLGRSSGSSETIEQFLSKKTTQDILINLKLNESIRRTALLSKVSEGKVKKVKKMIKEGKIEL